MSDSDAELLERTGYETREKLILGHWKKFGFHWDTSKYGPRFNIPIQHKISSVCPVEMVDIALEQPILSHLTFEMDVVWDGWRKERRGYVVKCEDIVVEQGWL